MRLDMRVVASAAGSIALGCALAIAGTPCSGGPEPCMTQLCQENGVEYYQLTPAYVAGKVVNGNPTRIQIPTQCGVIFAWDGATHYCTALAGPEGEKGSSAACDPVPVG